MNSKLSILLVDDGKAILDNVAPFVLRSGFQMTFIFSKPLTELVLVETKSILALSN